jgi:hypothetical protein
MTAMTKPARASRRPADRTIRVSVPLRDILVQTTTFAWRALLKMRRNPEQLADVTFMPLVLTCGFHGFSPPDFTRIGRAFHGFWPRVSRVMAAPPRRSSAAPA